MSEVKKKSSIWWYILGGVFLLSTIGFGLSIASLIGWIINNNYDYLLANNILWVPRMIVGIYLVVIVALPIVFLVKDFVGTLDKMAVGGAVALILGTVALVIASIFKFGVVVSLIFWGGMVSALIFGVKTVTELYWRKKKGFSISQSDLLKGYPGGLKWYKCILYIHLPVRIVALTVLIWLSNGAVSWLFLIPTLAITTVAWVAIKTLVSGAHIAYFIAICLPYIMYLVLFFEFVSLAIVSLFTMVVSFTSFLMVFSICLGVLAVLAGMFIGFWQLSIGYFKRRKDLFS